jgi:hypothetical protein
VDGLHLKLAKGIKDMDGLYITLEAAEEGLGHGRLHLDTFVQVLQGYDVELDEGDLGGGGRAGRTDRLTKDKGREGGRETLILRFCSAATSVTVTDFSMTVVALWQMRFWHWCSIGTRRSTGPFSTPTLSRPCALRGSRRPSESLQFKIKLCIFPTRPRNRQKTETAI